MEVIQLAEEFLNLLRQCPAEGFESWLMKALDSTLKPIRAFAKGLFEDAVAVGTSMMLDVSNGMVEGFSNRLKMMKRQMFGRVRLYFPIKRLILTQLGYSTASPSFFLLRK